MVPSDPRDLIASAYGVPRQVIATMAAAGANKEQAKGEDLRVVRIDGVHSEAWRVYTNWVCSLGEAHLLVLAHFAPPAHVRGTLMCPPNAKGGGILDEANSIINHFASLIPHAVSTHMPLALEPLEAPVAPIKVRHAKTAVTSMIQMISSPGTSFPVINAMLDGQYVCHLHYLWKGAVVTVPIFKL